MRDVLGITATSAPSERVFSITGNYRVPHIKPLNLVLYFNLIVISVIMLSPDLNAINYCI